MSNISVKQEYPTYTNSNANDLAWCLREIQAMLKSEAEFWYKSDNVKVADKIGHYDVAIDVLLGMVENKDVVGFVLAFKKFNLSIKGIRDCFRTSGLGANEMRKKRNAANRVFSTVCHKMIAALMLPKIQKEAQSKSLSYDEAKALFEQEAKDAQDDIKKNGDDEDEEKLAAIFGGAKV
jgi:hypothetical protein